jgi:hypothetical protein
MTPAIHNTQYVRAIAKHLSETDMPYEAQFLQDLAFELETQLAAPADTRAAFEAHFALSTRQAWRTTDGTGYQNTDVQKQWEGWQAAKGDGK